MHTLLKSGGTETIEMVIETINHTVLVKCTPVFNGNNNLERIIHVATDITARIHAQKELEKHRDHLEEMVNIRTRELRTIVNAMAGREVRMAGLKKTIKLLREQIIDLGKVPVANDPLNADLHNTSE